MYSDKKNVNQLTALMVRHGITDVVVCPGSRNGVLVHNFDVCPQINCYPVTDERSTAFFAIGLSLAHQRAVAVCVTSGTALLNTLPAVAEAFYQHIPLLVISADRPSCWIDQQDGQTLPQHNALGKFVKKSLQLPEPLTSDEAWWCNRLINEGLTSLTTGVHGPVHINVPISEPLFTFHTSHLPNERTVHIHRTVAEAPEYVFDTIYQAKFPILLMGQMPPFPLESLRRIEEKHQILVLPEQIANAPYGYRMWVLEERGDSIDFCPDLVIHIGGMLVNKQIKRLLRKSSTCKVMRIEEDERLLTDTFCKLSDNIIANPVRFIEQLADQSPTIVNPVVVDAKQRLNKAYETLLTTIDTHSFNSRNAVLRASSLFSEACSCFFANSSPIRYANALPFHKNCCQVFCNRGTNGIEGSLSTAVGYAAADNTRQVFCVIGDLSFFYDVNGLWNTNIRGNLHILLLNNGKGKIFDSIPGLKDSPAKEKLIAASHQTSAQNVASTYNIVYYKACNMKELDKYLPLWATHESDRPTLLEVLNLDE